MSKVKVGCYVSIASDKGGALKLGTKRDGGMS